MSTEPPPPGSGQAPDQPPDDQSGKEPPPPSGSPYDAPYGHEPPPYAGDPYGGGPYSTDPLAGMPPLAGSGKRVLARIIDMVIVGIVAVLLGWAFGLIQYTTSAERIEYAKSLGQEVIVAVLYVAYDTFFTARNGQTPGKQLMKLRTANLSDGSTPTTQTSLLRAAVLWIPFAFCCACIWTIIAGGWSFFDRPYKQGLHDKAAKTVVVSTA
ncbi:RDD family protein [Streptomyces sp. KM273126]|uniref:RDD family protein n=1 Tax=Streptomyces sp. KM273126 TaxID=2545247 RepID=UPI00103885D3|nr:RDD family protein [Streptomyces sp. KM273126]MBA2806521.1 RDD family protein [Streptomyces sp. KM273126]